MEMKSWKRMRRRCISLVLASAMVLTTPAADSTAWDGVLSKLVPTAKAATGQIQDTKLLDSDIVADATLLDYLREQTGQGTDATVRDLKSLSEVTIPAGVTDLAGLGYATSLTRIDASACTASRIDDYEFNNCTKLTEIILPDTVQTLGKNAFNKCTALTTINLGKVDRIGDQVFAGCSSLTDASAATMKDTLKQMGSGVFNGCKALTEAKVPVITTGENVHAVPAQMFNNCEKLEKVLFCDSQIDTISDQAFAGTGVLTFGEDEGNQLPATISSVGSSAFSGSHLTEIDMSQTGMTWISESTFEGSDVEYVTLPEKLTDIRKSAFQNAHIREITMPNTVVSLGDSAFRYAGYLLEVKLSLNLTEIPEYAFQGAGSYKFEDAGGNLQDWTDVVHGMNVIFNGDAADSKLETIGGSAFNASTVSNEDFLKDLKNLKTIRNTAFSYADFKTLTIPACVETIGESAFDGMYMLQKVVFADGSKLTELPAKAFGSGQAATRKRTYADLVLESVQLPENLQSIGADCFGNCWSLNTVGYRGHMTEGEVQFPETLQTIGEKAFEKCGFYEISGYDEEGNAYCANYCLTMYNGGFRKVTIPDSVTSLGDGAFQNCPMMEEIYFGDGLTELPANVCDGCGSYPYAEGGNSRLKDENCVITPTPVPSDQTTELGETTYQKLTFVGLKKVKFPKNLETIGEQAFHACYALAGFCNASGSSTDSMPGNLKTIGNKAFSECKSLESIAIPSSLETIGESAFAQTAQDVSLKAVSRSTGKTVSYYRQFSGLETVDISTATNLKTIGKNAFQRSGLTNIEFPESLTEVPDSVCEDCYHLETIDIPDSVTKIGNNAFKNTYSLDSMTAPFSADWAKTMFQGVTGYAKGKVTVTAKEQSKKKNIYLGMDNQLDFTCIRNFDNVSLTVTDLDRSASDEKNDLVKYDSNDYVSVAVAETAGSGKEISVYGKKKGTVNAQVSGSIHLEGDPNQENNTTSLNDAALVLQLSQKYAWNVTENPIGILEFSADRLVQEAQKNVLYLSYDTSKTTKLTVQYQGEDTAQYTTSIVNWSIEDENIAAVSGTPEPAVTLEPTKAKAGVCAVNLAPVSLGDTIITAQDSAGAKSETCTVRVRIPMDTIALSPSSIGSDLGETFQLKVDETKYSAANAELLEKNPDYGDVYVFASSNEEVATVDRNTGAVKAVGEGTATLTATSLVSGRSASCGMTVKSGYVPDPESVTLSAKEMTLYVGDDAAALTAEVLPVNAAQDVTWKSSNETVATVAAGTVKPVAVGSTTITAETANGRSASCTVTVKQHAGSVTLDQTDVKMYTGQSLTLKAEVLPESTTDKTLIWTSGNEAVATVNSSGTVKAVDVGETVITVTTADGKKAECKVSVKTAAESVTITPKEAALNAGEQTALTVSVLPVEADQTVEWTSSDAEVATVAGGVVTAVKLGKTTVTAKTSNGKTATCQVTVKLPVESVTLDQTQLDLEVGKTASLKAEVLPKDATLKNVTWTSSDETIAKVNSSGSVTAVKVGKATITATADGKSATCTVSVGAVVESVKLSAEKKKAAPGKRVTLTASVLPADANQTVTWKSSDETVATVENGIVTAVKMGTCTITATANGTSKTATCQMIVTAPKVKLRKAKNVRKKAVQVKWKKIEGVTGYQVACGKKKKLTAENKAKIGKLKKKKKYAVKVRAYTVVDGKNVFGPWSKAKKVKIKK